MRGRLINPMKARVARLDTVGTAADPDAGGPLVSGYDAVFREPLPKRPDAPGDPIDYTKYLDPILIPCQVEFDDQFEQLQQTQAGNDPGSRTRIIFHFSDLEMMGLVDPSTGFALLRLNDKLLSIHRFSDEVLIQTAGLQGGFFCTEARPVSFGLSGGERNLLICVYETRQTTFRGGQ